MDIAIQKKKTINLKLYSALLFASISLLFGARHLWLIGQADANIDRDSAVISEVKRGRYTVSVRGNGVLVPDNVQWLSAGVDATVEKIVLKAGSLVKQGDLIVVLANPQLVQELAEQKWELEAMEAEFTAARVAQKAALKQQRATVLDSKLNYESAELEFNAHNELVKTGAVSKLDFNRSQMAMNQAKQRWDVAKDELNSQKENLTAQDQARRARLLKTKKSVERIQQQVDELQVRATMDATVLEVPLEMGQRLALGANVAKLAQRDSLIAELRVPEIQIGDVAIGQRVIVDTRNSVVNGEVSRIDPAVVNGNVQVDVKFTEALPSDARPDLSVEGEIKITEIEDTLYVNRPLFAQSQSSAVFFRISDDGNFATRTDVKLGYGSVNQIEILSGLNSGDRIITSDPTRFENYKKIRLN